MIQKISNDGTLYAIIVHREYRNKGITFFTPEDFSQQLAYMKHPAGHRIDPHIHNKVDRTVHLTQEVLVIRRGSVKVDFYTQSKTYFSSAVLGPGDVILLATGGHGFTMLEETEMIEIKQGPYAGNGDKERFEGVQ